MCGSPTSSTDKVKYTDAERRLRILERSDGKGDGGMRTGGELKSRDGTDRKKKSLKKRMSTQTCGSPTSLPP